ncbi:hypothetical protein [Moraxella sp. ZY210820]|uniref:hypothetical protein n=1 Tax=unclassified Moraxella TaxID=2685852 RepID=UPI00272EF169|nr:hypothetical protein [Moraxella sp. ZY210820]WLF83983.1 hypothetical protein LU301_00265 [Moraxella sp. ZY210820]
MKKLLIATTITGAMCLSLTGCFTTVALLETKVLHYNTDYQQQAQDSIVGFVIHKENNQLIMLGNKYVYVFNNCESKDCHSDRLKQILQNPQFLQLKNMSWTTRVPSQYRIPSKYESNSVLLKADNKFAFEAVFSFIPQDEKEFKFLQQMGLLLQDEHISNIGRQYRPPLYLSGQMYEHNDSTRQLLKNAKPLSKQYTFSLLTQETKTSVRGGNLVKRILILPFAVVGDILFLPVQISAVKNVKNWPGKI